MTLPGLDRWLQDGDRCRHGARAHLDGCVVCEPELGCRHGAAWDEPCDACARDFEEEGSEAELAET